MLLEGENMLLTN